MIKNFKLYEVAGVSTDVMEWTLFLYGLIVRHGLPNFMRQALHANLQTTIEIGEEEYEVDTGVVNMTGKKMNDLIQHHIGIESDMLFRNFTLELGVTLMPEEAWGLQYFNGFYSDEDAYMNGDLLEGAYLFLDIYLPETLLDVKPNLKAVDQFLRQRGIRAKIFECLAHEMDHALEFYVRREKGQHIFPERALNYLITLNKDNPFAHISPDWQEFLTLCYLHLSHEQNARIPQVFYALIDEEIKTTGDFLRLVKQTAVWQEMVPLRDFDAIKFYQHFRLNADPEDIKDTFVETGVFSEEEVAQQEIKDLVLQKLIQDWDGYIDDVNQEFQKHGTITLPKLPVGKDPLQFLRFFEKRFHRHWNKFVHKIKRLAPDLIETT